MKKICVMGLGYIGLPTASMLETHGFAILGIDINSEIVKIINNGGIHIEEPGLHTLVQAAIKSGKLKAANEPKPADIFIIAVPTPFTKEKKADLSYIKSAAKSIAPLISKENLIILESTSPPGTCKDVLVPIFKSFDKEEIKVNQHGNNIEFNDNYYGAINPSAYVAFRISHILPFKSKTIKLIPYVDNLSKCKGDEECIFLNSYDLALLNNDESYCENLFMSGKDEFMGEHCYSMIALSKKDITLCKKVDYSAYLGKKWCEKLVNEEYGKEVCSRWYEDADRRFRACESLFEKYGCKHNSENCL